MNISPPLIEEITAWSLRTPDRIAVEAAGRKLSYGQLIRRSRRLARHLQAAGLRPEDLVGVCLGRDESLVVALLGVLEAGAAYVPLDPAYPRRRLEAMLRDAGVALLLSRRELLASVLPEIDDLPTMDVDTASEHEGPELDAEPDSRTPAPGQLAYVIYTSGSTGRPKGVQIPRGALDNFLASMAQAPGFESSDVLLAVTTTSFDIAGLELLLPLTRGGRVVLADGETAGDATRLARLADDCGATVLQATPATWRMLVQSGWPGRPGLKALCGGEALAPDLADDLRQRCAEVWNLYGPTETTIWSSVRRIDDAFEGPAPLGDAVARTSLHVVATQVDTQVDAQMREVADLEPGELLIGGAGLMRGYRGRPALSAEKLVPDPFGDEPGGRLYRTGDLVQRRDGELLYLGRIDHQVKVRGFRIEPGEIETALRRHPAVADAAVVAVVDDAAGTRLAAYLQAAELDDGTRQETGVDRWRRVWDATYASSRAADRRFDTTGWTSSTTGEQMPEEELREWRDETVERIRSLGGERLLEIGCGTGLLLFALARDQRDYLGLDVSATALDAIRRQLEHDGTHGVRLAEKAADDLGFLANGSFDTVVVNSVAQYFPDVSYLLDVVREAVRVAAPGASLFFGDIRSLRLHRAFCASVELERAAPDVPVAEIRERVERRLADEEELLVDPAFFAALRRELPRVRRVVLRPKAQRLANELRFRYDAILHLDRDAGPEKGHLAVHGVPNRRLAGDLALVELLEQDRAPASAADLRATLARRTSAFTPDAWERDVFLSEEPAALRQPWNRYANVPRTERLPVADVRDHLRRTLPEYMVPSAFVVLPELPRTLNNKVDRGALMRRPLPRRPTTARVLPRTATEEALLAVWKEVLGLDDLGVDDHFLDLGGHSLLAAQIASRVSLSPRDVFDAPTVAELAALLDATTDAPRTALVRTERPDDGLPLSFAQQRLWFLEQLAPEQAAYNLSDTLLIDGDLDVAALTAAIRGVVERHEALRTVFPEDGGRPVQRPAAATQVPILFVDLAFLPPGRRRPAALRAAAAIAEKPFDLREGPLIRLAVARLDEQRHLLTLVVHHIASDGWSEAIFHDEVDAFYRNANAKLPALPVQYADFAVWQRAALAAEGLERELDYWRRQLAAPRPVIEFPADRPRNVPHRNRRQREARRLTSALRRSVLDLGRRKETSLFMTLLAAWMAVVHRHTGGTDLLIGSPIAGRNRPEVEKQVEKLIGFFVNTLVLRGNLRGDPAFETLLGQVRATSLDAYNHQEIPFERLVEELRPERQSDRNPLFQVMFDLQNVPEQRTLGELGVRRLDVEYGRAAFEPSLSIREEGGGLLALVEYDGGLFDRTTIRRLLGHFEALVLDATASPEKRLGELALLSVAERQQLREWNDFRTDENADGRTFLDLLAAVPTDDAVAVVEASGAELCYGELRRRSADLAGELRRRGCGVESRVGVLMERSHGLVVALVGILEAGGAYVPLDPSYPEERLTFMIEDAGIELLLSDRNVGEPWKNVSRSWDVYVHQRGPERAFPARPPSPEDAAYVIYTSGSTGRPKGVVISHRALAWYCRAGRDVYDLEAGDRVLQFGSINFDISVCEIFPSLAVGAAVVLRNDEMSGSIEVFSERCATLGVTVLFLPTAFWHELAAEVERHDDVLPSSVRLISFGGEQVQAERVAAWHRRLGRRVRLMNGYGPTEVTVEATVHAFDPSVRLDRRVGRPIAGVRLALLDPRGRRVPSGVAGEVAVASDGLARGYLHRPAATAAAFVPNAEPENAGERLYRTGDLARLDATGALEILGRIDQQVKVRGFRVELGEIERTLNNLSAVREAAVVFRDRRLVAYVVPDEALDPAALRESLRRRLPGYMVPAAFVALEKLPLSPAGKVDRRALPDPGAQEGASPVGPRDALETKLARIWRTVLRRPDDMPLGVQDSFFDLGGHSLLATQVLAHIRSELGVQLPLRRLFDRATLAELAEEVRAAGTSDAPPLVPLSRERPLPLSYVQRQLFVLDRLEPDSSAYLMPDARELTGPLDVDALRRAVADVVERHEVLRSVFRETDDGEPVQEPVLRTAELSVVDLSRLPDAEREQQRLVAEDARRPFDLSRGPFRVALLRLADDRHVLLRTVHHIAHDAWSDDVFYRDLACAYRARRLGEPPAPRPTIQYADFAAWQRQYLQGDVLERQLDYWRRHLDGAPRRLLFPTDRPRTGVPSRRGAVRTRRLAADLRDDVNALGARHDATLHMTLLAAWAVLLRRVTGQEDLVVGVPVAHRAHAEVQELIGCFLNTLPLRFRVTDQPFETFLDDVRETTVNGYAHQELPFEKLVDELRPERDADANPIFQVMFDLHRPVGERVELDGLAVRSLPTPDATVHFEPSLTVRHEDDGSLVAAVDYQAELFDDATVDRLLDDYETLLRALVRDPAVRLDDVAPLGTVQAVVPRAVTARDADARAVRGYVERLRGLWQSVLDEPRPSTRESFFALGGDSILLIRLLAQARRQGLDLAPREVYTHQSIDALAVHLASRAERADVPAEDAGGPLPLTPIQRDFFDAEPEEPWHDNQSFVLRPRRPWNVPALAATLNALARTHEALRLRFTQTSDGWRQEVAPNASVPFTVVDLGRLRGMALESARQRAANQVQAGLRLDGPLVRAALLDDGQLLLAVHHLAVDAASWNVLLSDLEEAYTAFAAGRTPNLVPPAMSFGAWCRRLAGRRPTDCRAVAAVPLPVDRPGANRRASERTLVTRADLDVPAVLPYRLRLDELVLAALGQALGRWTGGPTVVDVESHGREDQDVDLSRTVGWLTAIHPVTLPAPCSAEDALRGTKDARREVSALDWSVSGTRLAEPPQVLFNYLGVLDPGVDDFFASAVDGGLGVERSRRGLRSHLLEVNGGLRGGQLELEWAWSSDVHHRATVEPLAADFNAELERLAAHCRGPVEDVYPLTPLQEGILFHTLYEPETGAYFEQLSWTLTDLDPDAWRRAWDEVVRRHPVFRTRFRWKDLRRPLQVVERHAGLEDAWLEEDWTATHDAETALDAFLQEDRERGFDLRRRPTRYALIRLGERRWQFTWSCSHLLVDGWSTPAVLEEVQAIYDAFRKGEEHRLPAVRPFGDFVAWLEEHRQAEAGEAFWRRALAGYEPPMPLAGHGAPGNVGEVAQQLDEDATATLQRLAGRCGVTLNTVVQAAWGAVLGAMTGSRDVVFGATSSGRPAELDGAEDMVGLFTNTLPVRVRTAPGAPVTDVLRRLQDEQVEARRYEHTPLLDIQGWAGLPAGAPLFESLLLFENYPLRRTGAESAIDGARLFTRTNYPLTLYSFPGERLEVALDHDLGRVPTAEAERLVRRLAAVLRALPGAATFDDATAPTAAERQRLLEWGRGKEITAPLVLVPERIFAVDGGRTAIVQAADGRTTSYAELDAEAARVAAVLRSRGVGFDVPVGVCLERSADLVVALLAVWKAGGAFVPVDPSYPEERRQVMAEDAGLALMIDAAALDELRRADAVPLAATAPPPDALAYVVYTSGSSGRPKGVEISHRALARFLDAVARWPGLTPEDRILALTTVSFDISQLELWLPLSRGATVVLVDDGADGERLARQVERHRPTLLQATPATWRLLIGAGWQPAPGMTLYCGGEEMPRDLAAWLVAHGNPAWNLYGPTEATIWALVHPLPADAGRDAVPIGRPLDGYRVAVTDQRLRLVPAGAPGELLLGGDGLARGYRGRPAQTAERFIPDPFHADHGQRLYRTGDLVRFRPDGTVDFLGRRDGQVKVRGYRIEIGEVEAAVASLDGVREAVVTVAGEGTDRHLVAWTVGRADPAPLHQRLPAYMVPTVFRTVPELPRTPAGKVDRRSLAAAGALLPATEPGAAAKPRTPAEKVLTGLWAEILDTARVGRRSHFFELGGHSLRAARLAARLRDVFGARVRLRDLFEHPVLEDMARLVSGAPAAETDAVRPVADRSALPLSAAQRGMWLLDQLGAGAAYHVHGSLELRGTLDVPALRRALGRVVERHETLRTTFADGCQRVAPAAPVAFPLVDLGGLPETRRSAEGTRLAADHAASPFDLGRGPLLRVALVRLDDARHLFLRTLHHIVADGSSEEIFYDELAHFYAERETDLPPLEIQYADFAAWQARRLEDDERGRLVGFWRRELEGAPDVLELPADRPAAGRSSNQHRHEHAGLVHRSLAPHMANVDAVGRRAGVTPFMVLLAAFSTVLARHAEAREVVVGAPMTHRPRRETEGLIGLFINTVPLRLRFERTVDATLAALRDTLLDAHAHVDLPFDELVRELRPARLPGVHPLFQVLFFQDVGDEAVPDLPGLEARWLDHEAPAVAPFALAARVHLPRSGETPSGEAAGLDLSFDAALFDRVTAQRLVRHIENVLRAFADADADVGTLPLLGAAERHQVLVEWNDTAAGNVIDALALVEAQVRRTPDAPALISENGAVITYRELDRRAWHFAAALRRRGATTDAIVALVGNRSAAMVTAMLATWKAGAAFLAVDREVPPQRREAMLDEVQPAFVWPVDARTPDARVPEDRERVVPGQGTGDEAAYLVFTSGSTGTPKAAVNTQRGLAEHLAWMRRVYPLYVGDRVVLKTPLTFDVAVWETFWPLACGAALVVAPPDAHRQPAALAHLVERHRATVIHFVPSMLPLFLDELADGERGSTLCHVVCGGEALPAALVERFHDILGRYGTMLSSFYGPCETSIGVAAHDGVDWRIREDVLPLGRPVDNVRLHVLGDSLEPRPIGAEGEIFIGGAAPGRGYLRQARLTAVVYLPDPWGQGQRLYRSGDRGRYRADGTLEFLGRRDGQLKIHGVRVEPDGVSAQLARHPEVREAAVTVRDGRLVAWVTPAGVQVEALRRDLAEHVPAAMVPSRIVALDTLPRTASGKVDRVALSERAEIDAGEPREKPRAGTEAVIAELFREILELDDTPRGRHADFFDLGGHSLLAVRLAGRLRDRLDAHVTLGDLLQAPTVAALAARVDRHTGLSLADGSPTLLARLREGTGRPIFCVHPISGHLLAYRELVQRLHPHAVYGLQQDVAGVHSAIPALATSYLPAVREAARQGPYRLVGYSMGGWIAFEMAHELVRRGEEVALLALIDPAPPGTVFTDGVRTAFAAELGLDAEKLFVDLVDLDELDEESALRQILLLARAAGIFGKEVNLERLRRLFRRFETNAAALAGYSPEVYPGRLTVFASDGWSDDELAAWPRVAEDVDVRRLNGDHRTILAEPSVGELAAHLGDLLA